MGGVLEAFSRAASLSLIWKGEGEFRREEPGEMSLREVSSPTPASAFLELLFVMRRGVTMFDLEIAAAAGSMEVVDVVVPERRRVLRRGGRFSVSSIVSHATDSEGKRGGGKRQGEERVRGQAFLCCRLMDWLNECRCSVCDVSCPTGCCGGGGGGGGGAVGVSEQGEK